MNDTLDRFVTFTKLRIRGKRSPIGVHLSRYGIVGFFKEMGYKVGVEVGTEHGRYARKLCEGIPGLKLYCVDPYQALPYYAGNKEQDEVDSFYAAAKRAVRGYDVEFIKKTSMEAVKDFEPNSMDFVFIDGNHYFEYIINDMIQWSRIVRPGGVFYGHDYSMTFDVQIAADAYMEAYHIDPWFIFQKGGKIIDCWMMIRTEEDQLYRNGFVSSDIPGRNYD